MVAEMVAMLARKPPYVFRVILILVSVMVGVLWSCDAQKAFAVLVMSLVPIRMFIYFRCKSVQPNWMNKFVAYKLGVLFMCMVWIWAAMPFASYLLDFKYEPPPRTTYIH